MAKLSINERLAQLISEKNMGMELSSVKNTSSSKTNNSSDVKFVRTDSVEIKSIGGTEDSQEKVSVSNEKVVIKTIDREENPFIHNQIVDEIAKRMLRAFAGN